MPQRGDHYLGYKEIKKRAGVSRNTRREYVTLATFLLLQQ